MKHCFLAPQPMKCLLGTANGLTPVQIGRVLGITAPTVRSHLAYCRKKLQVHSVAHAVAQAIRLKLIKPHQIVLPGECPGFETYPNYCRCACEGCKHHCAAHKEES